jgi:hypothetical protein
VKNQGRERYGVKAGCEGDAAYRGRHTWESEEDFCGLEVHLACRSRLRRRRTFDEPFMADWKPAGEEPIGESRPISMQPHDRLKHVRIARGETVVSVARRSGVSERLLRAIEDGRFDELPRGIYARAAIRSYAAAIGLDAHEILAECEPLLPCVDDPIDAMCRLRGLRVSATRESSTGPSSPTEDVRCPDWRLAAAAAFDALVVGAMLLILIASAAVIARAPFAAMGASAAAFGLMGVLLASSYFVWLGGLSGATAGEQWTGLRSRAESLHSLNLHAVALRAFCSATDDVRFVRSLGAWLGSISTHGRTEHDAADAAENPRPAVARS